MAEAKNVLRLRETKEQVFDMLKAAAPGLFGAKVFADVDFFGADPQDTSDLLIQFKEA